MKTMLQKIRETRKSASRMKFKADRVTKARDIESGRAGDIGLQTERANFLAEFLASGKRPRLNGEFAEPGDRIVVSFTFHNGNAAAHEFSWREYNRVLEAFKAGLLPKYDPIIQQTSQEQPHKAAWYRPSKWF